ncbi:hypothetical protein QTG54_010637 [Skeletonema marinoi]|uniref:Uncharacterized protein n=1 Tax=Skeletonema marinoi TaxID=267567 RepID=A0AAD8Y3X5_9STRA|nr:hypothetical protein QTG54_010637 [Skeletonema marinoi]
MADNADDVDGADVFIIYRYRGGRAPQHVTHVVIDKSVEVIEDNAFKDCHHLVQVETHDGIRRVSDKAFFRCKSLRRINLRSVCEVSESAFCRCENLKFVEFGETVEIGLMAFGGCSSLQRLNLTSIIITGRGSFRCCEALTDIEFSERLETIREGAFYGCERLRRIAIPLKRGLFVIHDLSFRYNQFDNCGRLRTVDLVGGAHTKTATSLHMHCWRAEVIEEINRINQVLPNTPADYKTEEIQQWMESVIDKIDHYRAEHCRFVKEAVTLLELALWKAKLGEKEENCAEGRTKKAKLGAESARREKRITCGADMVIKNVLPFLRLE